MERRCCQTSDLEDTGKDTLQGVLLRCRYCHAIWEFRTIMTGRFPSTTYTKVDKTGATSGR